VRLTFAPDASNKTLEDTIVGRTPVPVAGRTAIELEVLGAAPHRSCPRIASLAGTLWAVGPSKMLTFRFDKLAIQKTGSKGPAAAPVSQDGVTVRIASIRWQTDVLLVTVAIANPKDSPRFGTHESWLANNAIVLRRGTGPNKSTLTGTLSNDNINGNEATVTYAFTASPEHRIPDSLDGWTLDYETPGRIVELAAPFTLKDVALP